VHKFENMDVIAALEAIMHQNTAYYQSDFAYDIKMLREAATSRKISCCCGCPGLLEHSASGNGTCCSKTRKPTTHGNSAASRPATGSLPMRWS